MKLTLFNNIPLVGIKGVLLDLDNTLYDYHSCHKAAFATCKKLGKEKHGIEEFFFENAWKIGRDRVHHDLKTQGASHSRLLYVQKLYENIYGKSNPQFSLEMESVYWTTFIDHMQYAEGVEDFLKRIKEEKLKTSIVTDLTAQIQMQKWQKLGLGRYIDFLVTSEEAGAEKPDPRIYQLALEKMRLRPEDVIMIGDDLTKDVKGPEAIGIKAWQVRAIQ